MNKDHILKEIVRTAKENGGKPLGSTKFTKETGIRASDWRGRYWSKWGDALVEAGYQPNTLWPAYDKKWLIEQVISFIREIKKFPAPAELDLKSRNTKGFPGYDAFRRHFGGQPELANNIMSYCEDKSKYSDVYDICKKVSDTKGLEVEHYSKETNIEFGYVYLMKSGRFYKIGSSGNVERRNYELGIKLPENLEILHKIQTDDPSGIENYWHNRFRDKRKQGEWFDLSSSDISTFKRRKFM